jgi:hypothetical protein
MGLLIRRGAHNCLLRLWFWLRDVEAVVASRHVSGVIRNQRSKQRAAWAISSLYLLWPSSKKLSRQRIEPINFI